MLRDRMLRLRPSVCPFYFAENDGCGAHRAELSAHNKYVTADVIPVYGQPHHLVGLIGVILYFISKEEFDA